MQTKNRQITHLYENFFFPFSYSVLQVFVDKRVAQLKRDKIFETVFYQLNAQKPKSAQVGG